MQKNGDIATAGAERRGFYATRKGNLILEKFTQKIEVKALHNLEDGKFPIKVDGHCGAPK
jgi:hypothetical protein